MLRTLHLDRAVELFDVQTGRRIRVDAPESLGLQQTAPRSVQFSLTNHCNLACSFCSRPTHRPSTWTMESALEVLADLDRLGVAEVAFGGGEPLVFRGFFDLVDRLFAETRLGIHFTTNGMLLDDQALSRLKGRVGEIRLSLYNNNHWRRTVQRLVRHQVRFGINLLATPDTLPGLSTLLAELETSGCRDILLLPAVGGNELALSEVEVEAVRRLLHDYAGDAILKLGVCWGPQLADVPRLFPSSDCGAGREFFEITSDRHIRPCSFHSVAVPFETADDAVRVWREERDQLAQAAGCSGCPRGTWPRVATQRLGVRSYEAFASNNSGSYTLVGSFETSERAEEVASILNQLATDMEQEDRDSNPVQDLLRTAGIHASDEVAGYEDWPDLSFSSSPEAVALDRQVWWYCDYTISMPSELGHWFYAMGGKVETELDHTHHPQLAQLTLWPDLPWKERQQVDLQPIIDALWLGPLAAEGIRARVRRGGHAFIEMLWLAPEPEQVRRLAMAAKNHGLRMRLTMTESIKEAPDLDGLW